MGNVRRVAVAAATVLAVLAAGLGIGVLASLRKPIPDHAGEVSLTGIDGPITVSRDRFGIPTITATTSEDLFFAEGYVHAQDRFHEMDVRRHVASASLSTLIGDAGKDVDHLVAALGLPAAAQRQHDRLPASDRRALDAYARGVNAYAGGKSGPALSLEYTAKTLVGRDYRPNVWTGLDSVGWSTLLSWNLTAPITDDIDRIVIARHMSADRVGLLYPGYDMADSLAVRESRAFERPDSMPPLARLRTAVATVPRVTGLPTAVGTGAWVRQSDDGPELTAQMASAVSIPSPWYQVGLRCAKVTRACPYDVAGLSMAGMPGVVVGRNPSVAWGFGPPIPGEAALGFAQARGRSSSPVVTRVGERAYLTVSGDRVSRWGTITGLLAVARSGDLDEAEDAADDVKVPFALVLVSTDGRRSQVPDEPEALPRPTSRSALADLLVPSLLPVDVSTRFAAQGKATLTAWDRRMSAGEPGAAYFAAVWRQVLAGTFHDELPREQWPDGSGRWAVVMRKLLAHPNSTWWDNLATPTVVERRDDILRQAMEQARNELTMIRARDVNEWDWAAIHATELENPTIDGRLFRRGPASLVGSGETREATAWDAAEGFAAISAPTGRLEMSLTRPDASRWLVSTGVSGHPFSDHYTDQVERWAAGGDVSWPFSPDAVRKASVDRLKLTAPAR